LAQDKPLKRQLALLQAAIASMGLGTMQSEIYKLRV
jgi:hypothetical protein